MTTGRINQVTILAGVHPPERGIEDPVHSAREWERVVKRLECGHFGPSHSTWIFPRGTTRAAARGSLASHPIAPTEFPKRWSAADARQPTQ